ncbi:MAG: response regulator [Pseudomonadota bacterium]
MSCDEKDPGEAVAEDGAAAGAVPNTAPAAVPAAVPGAGSGAGPAAAPGFEPAAHVLVIDDDARIRDLLRRFLLRHGYLVTAARDAAHAERLLSTLAFDLLVLDVMMPGEDGISFARRMRSTAGAPILLLTARGEIEDRIAGLEAGADDYLAKPFEPRELLLRIAAILRRAAPPAEAPEKPKALHLGDIRYDIAKGSLERGEEMIRLTSSEQALMRVFARQPHEPVSRARLAEELGGATGEVQERAVDVQITRLRRKIEADPKTPRYLQTVRGAGYMLTPD